MEAATLIVHIAAGSLAILAGYVAIFAVKGADVHRRSGTMFVYAMVVMGMTGLAVAVIRDIPGSKTGGPLAAYFAITALTAVRPVDRRFDMAMVLVPLSASAMYIALVTNAVAQGRSTVSGVPIGMMIFLTSVALLSALSDIRLLRGTVNTGRGRIARHLWRMCFSLWIAAGSFFLGQMDEFPAWLQRPALMAIPAMLPLVLMLFWLWRIRIRRALAGLVLRQA
jgi:hypothetical protein